MLTAMQFKKSYDSNAILLVEHTEWTVFVFNGKHKILRNKPVLIPVKYPI